MATGRAPHAAPNMTQKVTPRGSWRRQSCPEISSEKPNNTAAASAMRSPVRLDSPPAAPSAIIAVPANAIAPPSKRCRLSRRLKNPISPAATMIGKSMTRTVASITDVLRIAPFQNTRSAASRTPLIIAHPMSRKPMRKAWRAYQRANGSGMAKRQKAVAAGPTGLSRTRMGPIPEMMTPRARRWSGVSCGKPRRLNRVVPQLGRRTVKIGANCAHYLCRDFERPQSCPMIVDMTGDDQLVGFDGSEKCGNTAPHRLAAADEGYRKGAMDAGKFRICCKVLYSGDWRRQLFRHSAAQADERLLYRGE